MTAKPSPISVLSLAAVLAAGLLLAGPGVDRAEAEDRPAQIAIDVTPTSNYSGGASGTEVTYVTSNGVPRTVFIADGLERDFNEPVAVYLNTSVLYNLYASGAVY